MRRILRYLVLGAALLAAVTMIVWMAGGPPGAFAQTCGGMHGGGGMHGDSERKVAPRMGSWHHARMHGIDWGEAADRFGKSAEELTPIERGEYVVESVCSDCHGKGGRGGVRNPNYEKGEVPRLDNLAETVGLFEQQQADKAVDLLKSGADLAKLRSDPPFDGFARFSAQIESIRKTIREGSEAAPEDPEGEDPVDMPSWGRVLSDREIDGVIAYLLTLQTWESEATDATEDGGDP